MCAYVKSPDAFFLYLVCIEMLIEAYSSSMSTTSKGFMLSWRMMSTIRPNKGISSINSVSTTAPTLYRVPNNFTQLVLQIENKI